ncbi:MAG: chemotaxis protein CheW [bacterium]
MKKIEPILDGQETEIDKKVLDKIAGHILDLLEDIITYRIEPCDIRGKKGKPEKGKIKLSSYKREDQIIVEIEDDGEVINNKVEGENKIKLRIDNLKKLLSDFNGGLHVNVDDQKRMKIVINLPVNLSMKQVLLVKCFKNIFAIPLMAVEETIKVKLSEIKTIEKKEVIQLRGKTIPFIRLSDVLQLKGADAKKDSEDLQVIIISTEGGKMGFCIKELIGQQEIVVKELGDHLVKVKNILGATILSNGEIALILDPSALIVTAKNIITNLRNGKGRTTDVSNKEESKKQKYILIVDDSISTRDLEKGIFEAAGFKVSTAINGIDALSKINKEQYDLIITDIDMPGMNGLELTARLKADNQYKSIPVVVVSSLQTEEDKKKGIEAGAEAYITKSSFNQASLLELIGTLI